MCYNNKSGQAFTKCRRPVLIEWIWRMSIDGNIAFDGRYVIDYYCCCCCCSGFFRCFGCGCKRRRRRILRRKSYEEYSKKQMVFAVCFFRTDELSARFVRRYGVFVNCNKSKKIFSAYNSYNGADNDCCCHINTSFFVENV